MSKLNINGVELELDLLDADVMEKYESLTKEMMNKVNDRRKYDGVSTAESMKIQCRMVEEFFDRLFGKGTSREIFVNHNHLGEHMDAFGKCMQISKDANREVEDLQAKYGVQRLQNRDERRNVPTNKQQYNNRQNGGKYRA